MGGDFRPPLDVPDAARRLQTTELVIRQLLKNGKLKGFKVGREWRITADSIEKLEAGEAAA